MNRKSNGPPLFLLPYEGHAHGCFYLSQIEHLGDGADALCQLILSLQGLAELLLQL